MTRKRPRLRVYLTHQPQFDGVISGFVYKFAVKNLWRVTPDLDMEDIISEGRLAFCKCANRYQNITEAKHFFALFRTTFVRQITTIAGNRRLKLDIPFTTLSDSPEFEANIAETDGGLSVAEIEILKKDAPPHIAAVIEQLVETEMQPRPRYVDCNDGQRHRESHNRFLCRLAGCDPEKTNMLQEVLAWLDGRKAADYAFQACPQFV